MYNYRDIVAGAFLLCIGASVSAVAYFDYALGTIARMGPGMFPLILGIALGFLGLVLVFKGLTREGNGA